MLKEGRLLLQLAGLTFFFNFFFGVYSVVLPLMARNHFGGAEAYGLLWSAFAVGSFIRWSPFECKRRYQAQFNLSLVSDSLLEVG
jgi:hypothetical protein